LEVAVNGASVVGHDDGVDPMTVHTLPEFASALQWLRGSRSYAELDKAVNPNQGRQAPRVLPPSTLNNLLHGKSVPTRETVVRFLTACDLDEARQEPWLAAWDRVATASMRRPTGAVRVREARPRLLGVHASIQVAGVAGELPTYVPRDVDADLRTAINAAADRGGLVLLVGDSSVGKTRTLFEAVRADLAEWWLLHPNPADSGWVDIVADARTPRIVVWLDELQIYLDSPSPLSIGVVRDLLGAGIAMVGTLWPHEYHARRLRPVPGEPDPYANDRSVLGLAQVIDVPSAFSVAERRRAEEYAADGRVRVALDSSDGFTQVLAAGPELVRRWENASDHYSNAVITAALDACRMGAYAPLSRGLLAAAAPAYLTSAQQAIAPTDWLDQAIAYATTQLHGAASVLVPVAEDLGRVAGYTVADYLRQHSRRTRRTVQLPDQAWRALVEHHHPDDCKRLINNALRRGRYAAAEDFYRQTMDRDVRSLDELIRVLVIQQRIDDAVAILRSRADAGDAYRLVEFLREQGRVDELRELADRGDTWAEHEFAGLLAGQGRVDELRQRSTAGSRIAAHLLIHVLVERDDPDEVFAVLRQHPGVMSWLVARDLVDVLVKQGRGDDALALARSYADSGTAGAAHRLVDLLADYDCIDELRQRAEAGDPHAASRLVGLLLSKGHVDEAIVVLQRGPTGDYMTAMSHDSRIVHLLAEQGRVDTLQQQIDAGNRFAVKRLVEILEDRGQIDDAIAVLQGSRVRDFSTNHRLMKLLAKQGSVDELRRRADAGHWFAADELANLFVERGNVEEALALYRHQIDLGAAFAIDRMIDLLVRLDYLDEALATTRQYPDLSGTRTVDMLVDRLLDRDRIDDALALIRPYADGGNSDAAERLIDLLAAHSRLDELQQYAGAGSWTAAYRLAELLVAGGRIDDAVMLLRPYADRGDSDARETLIDLLARHGRLDDLQQYAYAGDWVALDRLAALLLDQGRIDDAIVALRPHANLSLSFADETLAELLARRGLVDELRERADKGDLFAIWKLVDLLAEQGRIDELTEEVAAGMEGAAERLNELQKARRLRVT
jgi:tetratricopeptide (TPR) repeat protein